MCDHIIEELLIKCGENVIDLAISNVKVGGLLFAAIIVNQNGELIGKGVNQVTKHLNCTAHAEIQAIREASRNEKTLFFKRNDINCFRRALRALLYGNPYGGDYESYYRIG